MRQSSWVLSLGVVFAAGGCGDSSRDGAPVSSPQGGVGADAGASQASASGQPSNTGGGGGAALSGSTGSGDSAGAGRGGAAGKAGAAGKGGAAGSGVGGMGGETERAGRGGVAGIGPFPGSGNAGAADAGSSGTDGGAGSGDGWPKRVTLVSAEFAMQSPAVRLTDGELVETGGDMVLFQGVQLSLRASSNDSAAILCNVGTHVALADVPTEDRTCSGPTSGGWAGSLFLSGATPHTDEQSQVIGLSALVRNAEHDQLYRLRVLGDSVSLHQDGTLGTATVTFEYERVP